MNLIDEIILGEAKKKDSSYQRRGPTPGGEGGSDTGKRHQPLACPHSTAGSVRRMVQGSPPPGTMPMSGEKFESDEQGQAMSDYLMGRPPRRGKKKKVNDSFESCLMSALIEDQFSPELTPSQKRSGHRLGPQVNPKRKRGVKQGIPIPKDTVIPEPQQKSKDAPTGMRTSKTRKQTQFPTDRPQDQEFLGDAPRDIDTRTPWEKTLTNKDLVARAIRKAGGPEGVAKRRARAREDKRERDREQKEWEAANESFESCLMSAIFSNEEMLLEFTSKNWERRGHVKKMSRGKKLLIGGALAAALAAGVVGSKGKQDTGPTDQQTTHQTQGHSGQGASGELDDRPTSMGRGRVTTDKDLGIGKKKSKTPWGDKHGPYDPAKHGKYDPDLPGPTGKGPDPRNR